MNKQLLLVATLIATQASMQAVDASYFQQLSDCGKNARTWVSEAWKQRTLKPEMSYLETIKKNLLSAKDASVNWVTSFNKPTMPTWESTKNLANGLKDATITTASNTYISIQDNAPVYFDAAQKYAVENPGTVAAITAGSIAALVVMYKAVKYFRNSDEMYRDYDAVVQPVKHFVRKK